MPPRSLRWIRPSAGASWARAGGATAAAAEAAAVVFMNARRFISYGEVMVLPLQLEGPGIVTLYHSRLDGRIASTFPKLDAGGRLESWWNFCSEGRKWRRRR